MPPAPAHRTSRAQLMTTVAVATLAAVVCFSLFYVVGAVIGLAVMAALGVALIAGLAWAGFKLRRKLQPAPIPARMKPMIRRED